MNNEQGFYILRFYSDLFDLKDNYFDKKNFPWDRYYLFGYSKNYKKTHLKILKYFKDNYKGILFPNEKKLTNHLEFIEVISFFKKSKNQEFNDYVEKILNIKIYTDDFYNNLNNSYSLSKLLIGDFDDSIMGKVLSYRTNYIYTPPYDCHIHNFDKLSNDWRNNPYREFEPDGKGSIGSGDNIVHFRRRIKNCTYLYIVGGNNCENGIHNFKVGIAKDLNARKIFYQSHSPNKIKFYFFQSCYNFDYAKSAERYERTIHRIIERYLGMIHQDWCRISLDNILELVKHHFSLVNQPIYQTIKYRDNEDIYIPIKTINKFSPHKNYYASPDHGDSDHICIDEYSFELSFIPDGRYGTVKERDSKKQLIKKFKDLKSLYEYFYKNFDKITKPRSLAEK